MIGGPHVATNDGFAVGQLSYDSGVAHGVDVGNAQGRGIAQRGRDVARLWGFAVAVNAVLTFQGFAGNSGNLVSKVTGQHVTHAVNGQVAGPGKTIGGSSHVFLQT